MRIRLYGRLADAIGFEIEFDAAGAPVGAIRELLAAEHPAAADSLARSRAVIGAVAVGDDYAAGESDCVEFLPPVSGG